MTKEFKLAVLQAATNFDCFVMQGEGCMIVLNDALYAVEHNKDGVVINPEWPKLKEEVEKCLY